MWIFSKFLGTFREQGIVRETKVMKVPNTFVKKQLKAWKVDLIAYWWWCVVCFRHDGAYLLLISITLLQDFTPALLAASHPETRYQRNQTILNLSLVSNDFLALPTGLRDITVGPQYVRLARQMHKKVKWEGLIKEQRGHLKDVPLV